MDLEGESRGAAAKKLPTAMELRPLLLTLLGGVGVGVCYQPGAAVAGLQQRAHVARRAVPILSDDGPLADVGRDVQSLWSRLLGTVDEEEEERQIALASAPANPEDVEFVPLVLVVGAGGRTGRIIV